MGLEKNHTRQDLQAPHGLKSVEPRFSDQWQNTVEFNGKVLFLRLHLPNVTVALRE